VAIGGHASFSKYGLGLLLRYLVFRGGMYDVFLDQCISKIGR